jgi:DNA-binding IscR family transcriptional regulator
VAIPSDELEDTLASLEEMRLVRREGRSAYALAKAPEAITLGELYNVAVHSGEAVAPEEWTNYSPELAEAALAMEAAFSKPLGSLAPSDAGETPAPGRSRT